MTETVPGYTDYTAQHNAEEYVGTHRIVGDGSGQVLGAMPDMPVDATSYEGRHYAVEPAGPEADGNWSPERLAALSAEAGVMVHTWNNPRGVPEQYGAQYGGQYQTLYNQPLLAEHGQYYTPEDVQSEYAAAGIAETLTVTNFKAPFHRINPASARGNEPTTVITYETMTMRGGHFYYKDGFGRPGNLIRMHVELPASEAAVFLRDIREKPERMHTFLDEHMTGKGPGQFGMDTAEWERFRPPFGEWREKNGGVSKLAIRHHIDEYPEESEVIDF
jgi:hypothetical protein